MKIRIELENDTSGQLDHKELTVVDEDSITNAVLYTIEEKHWSLRPGDSIKISEMD